MRHMPNMGATTTIVSSGEEDLPKGQEERGTRAIAVLRLQTRRSQTQKRVVALHLTK